VIAADARVDDATLAGYAGLADKLFRIEYQQFERHLAWLYRMTLSRHVAWSLTSRSRW